MKETDIVIDIHCHSPKPIQEGSNVDSSTDSDAAFSSTVIESPQSKSVGGVVSPDGKKDKRKATSGKKPPKPPRPPRGLSLDAADQRLIKELSEIAIIKRAARIQRLKRMKAANGSSMAAASSSSSSSSVGNVVAVLFTIVFCLVIIFRGCHPPGHLVRNKSGAEAAGNIVMVGAESSLLRRRIE